MQDFKAMVAMGVFHVPKGATAPVAYPDGKDPVAVLNGLEAMEGRAVVVSAHYLPSNPPEPTSAGFGGCLMGDHCATGHAKDPTWMLDFRATGVLRREGFAWFVGDERIPLGLFPGHRGRITMATSDADPIETLEGGIPDATAVDDTIKEAAELEELLRGLQDAVSEIG